VSTTAVLSRIERSRMGIHVGVLCLVLAFLMILVDVERGVYDADEGALLMQVQILAAQSEWFVPIPTLDIDPGGVFVAVGSARIVDGTMAPFPFRPALVTMTTELWKLGGILLATVPGLLGLVVAATVAADLARRIDPRARIVTFWVAGLASPLLFQSFALQGHAPAAGFSAAMVWSGIRASEHSGAPRLVLGVCAFVAGSGAALLRREVVVLAGAWVIATLLEDVRGRRMRYSLPAIIALAGTLGGTLGDQILARELTGTGLRGAPIEGAESVVVDRVMGLLTMVNPGYEGDPVAASLLAITSALVLVVTVIRFRSRGDSVELIVGTTVSAALLLVRLAVGSRYMIQGLMPAFPLGVAAILLSKPSRGETTIRLLRSTTILFVVSIGLTQYRAGGGFEWASRYTTIVVPVAAPVIGVTVVRLAERVSLERRTAILALCSLAAIALVPSAMGLIAQRHARQNNAASVAIVEELAVAGNIGLVVSTNPEIPRANPDQLEGDLRWLWIPADYFSLMLPRLEEAGIEEVVLVTKEPDEVRVAAALEGWEVDPRYVRKENPGRAMFALMRTGAGNE
jgi:hypothetical protein